MILSIFNFKTKKKYNIIRNWDEAQLIVIKMTLKQLTLPSSKVSDRLSEDVKEC